MRYADALVAGLVVGGAYSLLAIGVSLIFSTSGILNFAHAGFAMVAAYVYAWLGTDHAWDPKLAAVAAVVIVTFVGLLVERLVIRWIADASATTRVVATLGVLLLLQGLMLQFFGFLPQQAQPIAGNDTYSVGSVSVSTQQASILIAAVVLAVALEIFLRGTRRGLAIRAAAQDRDVARLMGIGRAQVARTNWGIAAFLAAVAGVLIAPLTVVTIGTFPLLLVKALAATLLGGLTSIVGAWAGGFLIGGAEGLAGVQFDTTGVAELFVFLLVLAVLLARRRWPRDLTSEDSDDAAAARGFPYFAPARVVVGSAAVLVTFLALRSDFWAFVATVALVYALGSLSLVVLTGWSGQVSLVNGSLIGVGAFGMVWYLNSQELNFVVAIVLSAVTAAAVGAALGLVSLRLRGLQLGIATLVASAAASEWLFQLGDTSRLISRPDFFVEDRHIFWVLLPVAALLFLFARNLRSGPWGRMFLATRRSEETAAHFAVTARRARVSAFAVSGLVAGTAGAFFAVLLTALNPADFGPLLSISIFVFAVVGGIESLAGPLIAGLLFGVAPQIVKVSQETANALPNIIAGLIVLAHLRPGGLAALLRRPVRAAPIETATDDALAGLERARPDARPGRLRRDGAPTLRRRVPSRTAS